MYLFNTTIPESPYIEKDGDEIILTFHFRVLQLWTLDARHFVQHHIIAMYTLLPAMRNVSASLLIEAINELRTQYTPAQFGEHLARFKTILERSETLSVQEKKIVEEHVKEYNSLLEESPFFQNMVREKNIEVGMQVAQRMVTTLVTTRFPSLTEFAKERVSHIGSVDSLDILLRQMATAPDETVAKKLLDTFAA